MAVAWLAHSCLLSVGAALTSRVEDQHATYVLGIARAARAYDIGGDRGAGSGVRLSHAYWVVGALHLLRATGGTSTGADALELVRAAQNADGGFGPRAGHLSDALQTLSAMQLAALHGQLSAFRGAEPGPAAFARSELYAATAADVDPKRACCALLTLALLDATPDRASDDAHIATRAFLACLNADGGFGGTPGGESHAGATFCCLAGLSVLGALDEMPSRPACARWLAERQQPCGGFAGRADKEADLCYSWWVLASLRTLGALHWVDVGAARAFVRACADPEGGLAWTPGEPPDPYHTFFGLMALALVQGERDDADGANDVSGWLPRVDPVFALPSDVVARERLRSGSR